MWQILIAKSMSLIGPAKRIILLFLLLIAIIGSCEDSNRPKWRVMNVSEFEEWYPREADRCQLKLTEKTNWVEARSACQQFRRRNSHPHTLQCGIDSYGVGLGYKHNCIPPMKRRTYFNSVLIGYEDPHTLYLSSLLQALAQQNRSLVILGDSLSYQTIQNIACELYREQVDFERRGDSFIPFEGRGRYTFYFRKVNSAVHVYYKRLDNIRLSHQFDILPGELSEILQSTSGYVLLTNIGLNYNSMTEYEEDIPKYFHWLENLTTVPDRKVDVVWRETTASHWSYSDNGYYNHEKRANSSKEQLFCAPHKNGTDDPRNGIVRKVLSVTMKDLFKNIHYVPFYFVTQDIWTMHTDFPPYPGGHADCVHYCYHPVFWQPVWQSLVNIVVMNMTYAFQASI